MTAYSEEFSPHKIPEIASVLAPRETFSEIRSSTPKHFDDLVCFSFLRWNAVYQRPHHLMSRYAKQRRVFFIEEPLEQNEGVERLEFHRPLEGITVVTPIVRHHESEEVRDIHVVRLLRKELYPLLSAKYAFYYFTPLALGYSRQFEPTLIVYDCMDELTGFLGASPRLPQLEDELLSSAAVVFTGGKSLYHAKRHLHPNIRAMPSSLDKSHFEQARNLLSDPADQRSIARPRFGYFGAIDERMDTELMGAIADLRPQWQFIYLGPVLKISHASLPQRENIHYLGHKPYDLLPQYLANWDVALMPFAQNEATRFISPTKTPEYLAGGRAVVSTPIADVVKDYGEPGLVLIAATAEEFIAQCEVALSQRDDRTWQQKVDEYLSQTSWDYTWQRMNNCIKAVVEPYPGSVPA